MVSAMRKPVVARKAGVRRVLLARWPASPIGVKASTEPDPGRQRKIHLPPLKLTPPPVRLPAVVTVRPEPPIDEVEPSISGARRRAVEQRPDVAERRGRPAGHDARTLHRGGAVGIALGLGRHRLLAAGLPASNGGTPGIGRISRSWWAKAINCARSCAGSVPPVILLVGW